MTACLARRRGVPCFDLPPSTHQPKSITNKDARTTDAVATGPGTPDPEFGPAGVLADDYETMQKVCGSALPGSNALLRRAFSPACTWYRRLQETSGYLADVTGDSAGTDSLSDPSVTEASRASGSRWSRIPVSDRYRQLMPPESMKATVVTTPR
ncbi:unnamed protein product [Schistocephalus solidus]|uniref:Uncharacterized protein n=1 Tax=Schistocephalus solidus TaxID=70667 RepID=A0A183SSV0_SCHSO|nr:unnamed protein product [Schistocephalus solidus]